MVSDASEVLVHREVQAWLDPMNHRTRENRPWSARHAENVAREWRLRIAPHIPVDATPEVLDDKQLWIRILNTAQASGLAASLMGHHSPDFTGKRYLSLRTGWLDAVRDVSKEWPAP